MLDGASLIGPSRHYKYLLYDLEHHKNIVLEPGIIKCRYKHTSWPSLSLFKGEALRNLLQEALTKLPRIAFAAALDTWRWDVFEGKVRGGR